MTQGIRPLPESAEASEFDAERFVGRRVDQLRSGDHVVIAGAGPAGLTAAYLLAKEGTRVTVLEADDVVGGLARTVEHQGYRFDIGGHRFFTKIAPVQALWRELLGDELIKVPRLSRIHYRGRYFDYPLKAFNALRGLGLINTLLVLASYARAHLWPSKVEENFEQWVCNRFGRRLYEIFFKTYTEKVWGIPCTEIRAEWAAQRIHGLSLAKAIWSATSLQRRDDGIKTLIHEFDYPRLGPGQMWERARDRLVELGGEVRLRHRVLGVERRDGRVVAVRARIDHGEVRIAADHFISTIPVGELVRACTPRAPAAVRRAGLRLNYRDMLVVALILRQRDVFPDNWVYIHTPGVRVGRIQNVNNWSRAMVPDPATSCIEMEYFCFEWDDLWSSEDGDLIALARRELGELGLADPSLVVEGKVVRMPKAYPVYDSTYRAYLDVIRSWLDGIPNLHTIGRNGMHKYNNQDHSMLTAMLALDNMRGAAHDLWSVNTDFEYHETQRVPAPAAPRARRTHRAHVGARRWPAPHADVTS
ncbi:MAG: NAD(P)/FAD-dependent oxidoreductase [Gemmatimonadaceae bacterium]